MHDACLTHLNSLHLITPVTFSMHYKWWSSSCSFLSPPATSYSYVEMQRSHQNPVIKHPQTMFPVHVRDKVLHPFRKGMIRVLYILTFMFLGSFTKLQEATTSFITSLCPSIHPTIHMEQLGSHQMDVCEIWYEYFLKIYQENASLTEIWHK